MRGRKIEFRGVGSRPYQVVLCLGDTAVGASGRPHMVDMQVIVRPHSRNMPVIEREEERPSGGPDGAVVGEVDLSRIELLEGVNPVRDAG